MQDTQRQQPVAVVTAERPDDREPSPERQADLRAACEANVAAGRPPYQEVNVRTRGELMWIVARHGWDVEHDEYTVKYVLEPRGVSSQRADLRRIRLVGVNLAGANLFGAHLQRANLSRVNLEGATLVDADLEEAGLGYSTLAGANLKHANLSGAHLRQANLAGAVLQFANLCGARLFRNDLRGATLVGARMDSATVLVGASLDARTQLRDVVWNGAQMTAVDWERVNRLGDEQAFEPPNDQAKKGEGERQRRIEEYRGAVRAYQQLAVALQGQGMGDVAGRFTYRAQVLQRRVLWKRRHYGKWLFSAILDLLSGYGYRLSRILIAYVLIVFTFAAIYYVIGLPHAQPVSDIEAAKDALLVSLTALHGRVFQEQLGTFTPAAWIAAVESICGIVVEGIFVAMLIQRFFTR
jgi:uncharacterized protein YjbI with pentapeptide repeats